MYVAAALVYLERRARAALYRICVCIRTSHARNFGFTFGREPFFFLHLFTAGIIISLPVSFPKLEDFRGKYIKMKRREN